MSSKCRICGDLIGNQRKGSEQLCNVCKKIKADEIFNDNGGWDGTAARKEE